MGEANLADKRVMWVGSKQSTVVHFVAKDTRLVLVRPHRWHSHIEIRYPKKSLILEYSVCFRYRLREQLPVHQVKTETEQDEIEFLRRKLQIIGGSYGERKALEFLTAIHDRLFGRVNSKTLARNDGLQAKQIDAVATPDFENFMARPNVGTVKLDCWGGLFGDAIFVE